jgi:uncharacterized protein (TIGR04141 family)
VHTISSIGKYRTKHATGTSLCIGCFLNSDVLVDLIFKKSIYLAIQHYEEDSVAGKNKLNIFLIKEGFPNDKIIEQHNSSSARTIQKLTIHNNYKLYIRANPQHRPDWVTKFFDSSQDIPNIMVSSIGSILIIPISMHTQDSVVTRLFALAFGYGRALLNPSAIEQRFGLKCVLNSVADDALRKIGFTDVSGNAKRSSEQLPRSATIAEFALDVERNLLNNVTAKGQENDLLDGTITGGDSISLTKNIDINIIENFLPQLYQRYRSNKYKENFEWVDNISPVKDPDLKRRLWDEAIHQINPSSGERPASTLWMAIPDILNWESVLGFQIAGEPKSNGGELPLHDDILLPEVIASFRKPLQTYDQLSSKKILVKDSEDTHQSWSADKCLVGEIELGHRNYCVSDGAWYEIQKDYEKRINEDYRQTKHSDISFIPYLNDEYNQPFQVPKTDREKYEIKCEERYNYELERQLNHSTLEHYMLMDRHLVSYGGGRSREEFCDLLSDDGQRIHVKRYSGSAVMSHLFNQGLVSASLEKDADAFTNKVNDIISEIGAEYKSQVEHFLLKNNQVHEVVFGIVAPHSNSTNHDLPFFSKVAFSAVKKQLQRMGLETSIQWIENK